MGRSVEPQTAEPGDRLLPEPDPPELIGDSPRSTFDRSSEGEGPGNPISTGVQDPELEELADTGDYIPLSS